MSSSLSDVPSHVSPWQINRVNHDLAQLPNNGESSRQARLKARECRQSLPGPSERAASLSFSHKRLKRSREDTPRLADEAMRSTSIENVRQNASAPSFGPMTAGAGESITASNDSTQQAQIAVAGGQGSEDNEGGESNLFSERTQPLPAGEGDEEDDFLPDTEEEVERNVLETAVVDTAGGSYTETIKDGTTSTTENLDNPISLGEGELFCLEEQEETVSEQPAVPKASDYLPRAFAPATTAANADVPSLTISASADSDRSRPPRLPTPIDHMTRVIDQCLPYRTFEVDEEAAEAEDDVELGRLRSYHSNDSELYEMTHRPILERTAIKRDIREFVQSMECLKGEKLYRVVDRLGEGTFSSVYLAYDLEHDEKDNAYWVDSALTLDEGGLSGVRVALKKILATSSPQRIHNELQILENLRGCRNVSQLITAFREEDQIIVVLPYHQSDDFRHFYRHMDAEHTRLYMRSLLEALKDTHARGIIHRDVKPANFLFDYESCTGVLCDFGLAERYTPPRKSNCQHAPATLSALHGSKQKTGDTSAVEQAVYDARKKAKLGEGRVGFLQDDKRGSIKTNRAGTRGFRAPEVLLKCPDQTVAIDIWSAGIMLLSILTHKFPVFNSNDDVEALMEIAAVYGRGSIERCAMLHNRTIICNVPTIDSHPNSIKQLILTLNPHIYTPPLTHPTADDARQHIEEMDQAMDLCARLLRLDATKRSTAAQALRHPFLASQGDSDAGGPLDATQGKCGDLHGYDEHGRHTAYFGADLVDMHFGMGIPPATDQLCPEHLHFQERNSCNPLATSRRYPDREVSKLDSDNCAVISPEKIFKRDPPPLLSFDAAPPSTMSIGATTFRREALGTMSQNKPLPPCGSSYSTGAKHAVGTAGGGGTDVITSSGLGLSGLSRFIGKDREDEGWRAAVKRRLV